MAEPHERLFMVRDELARSAAPIDFTPHYIPFELRLASASQIFCYFEFTALLAAEYHPV